MEKAFSPGFRAACRNVKNPYGGGYASRRILKALSRVDWDAIDLKKKFVDMRGGRV